MPENIILANFDKQNLFAAMIQLSFYKHLPLRLTPESVWLTISQGFARHIRYNRDKLVKARLIVSNDNNHKVVIKKPMFINGVQKSSILGSGVHGPSHTTLSYKKGSKTGSRTVKTSMDNAWPETFPTFLEVISEKVKDAELFNMMKCDFSSSGDVDLAICQITLADTSTDFSEISEEMDGCGIPSIELSGTVADWKLLRKKARFLAKYDLEWWTVELVKVLDKFVEASQGEIDKLFWNSVCNLLGTSGKSNEPVTGWIQTFFPYLSGGQVNSQIKEFWKHYILNKQICELNMDRLDPKYDKIGFGVRLSEIPNGISEMAFSYVDMRAKPDMKNYDFTLNSGIVAVRQDPVTFVIEPVLGWAVLDKGAQV